MLGAKHPLSEEFVTPVTNIWGHGAPPQGVTSRYRNVTDCFPALQTVTSEVE